MTPGAKTRFLHVANGTCVTGLIEAAGIPGTRSIWADPLHEGPVPGGLNDAEMLDVRMRYHTGPADVTFAAWRGSATASGSRDTDTRHTGAASPGRNHAGNGTDA